MSSISNRLRNRALARLSLKKPSKLDEADAALDTEAAGTIDALMAALEGCVNYIDDTYGDALEKAKAALARA